MFREYLAAHGLRGLLLPPGSYAPFPRRQDRESWLKLSEESREAIVRWGGEALGGYPMLTATQFLAFCRSGSRLDYEKPYFARRNLLIGAVLAECVLDDGAHLDAVIDGLWCICEETTWVLSAHNGSDHPGALPMNARPLADEENPYVDLFAAQTAATLAYTLYFLEDKLDAVSPLIARRVRAHIEKRIFRPFMTHDDFWWMGFIRKDMCNWTPWIISNVFDACLLLERDALRQSELLSRGLCMLDSYLAVMPRDGGCDEGAAYFNMAGASLLDCLECVYAASGGRVSFYHEPLIRNIGAFPLRAHVHESYFLNFADCDAKPNLDGARIWRYGVRTENGPLASLGAWLHGRRKMGHGFTPPSDTPQMNRILFALFDPIPGGEAPAHEPFCALPDLQVFSWRKDGLFAAIKGVHNAENHNHNDVGSFIVYADGEPQIVDMGNKIYTALTFGPLRYTIDNTRAMNHNVPLIGGMEQCFGRQHAAHSVQADERGAKMDIAAAYPQEAGVRTLQRELTLCEGGLTLCDSVSLEREAGVTWVLMLRHEPALSEGCVKTGALTIRYDAALSAQAQEMPVTDERMAKNFPGSLWRLTLSAPPAAEHTCLLTITRS